MDTRKLNKNTEFQKCMSEQLRQNITISEAGKVFCEQQLNKISTIIIFLRIEPDSFLSTVFRVIHYLRQAQRSEILLILAK
jgi:hypothetical protein